VVLDAYLALSGLLCPDGVGRAVEDHRHEGGDRLVWRDGILRDRHLLSYVLKERWINRNLNSRVVGHCLEISQGRGEEGTTILQASGRDAYWRKNVIAYSDEEMVLRALLVTFEKHKLPRALSIKEKVDKGGLLSDGEVEFLEEVIDEANRAKPLMDRHPELQALYAHTVRLYDEITVQALTNEQRG